MRMRGKDPDSGHNYGWPVKITKELLRDAVATDRIYMHACEIGWIDASAATRLGFHAVAVQVSCHARDPGRLFTFMVRRRKWLKSTKKGEGGVTQRSERVAEERIKLLQGGHVSEGRTWERKSESEAVDFRGMLEQPLEAAAH